MNCPNCKKEIPNQDASFCPYCSKSLTAKRHTRFPIAAGILTLVSAVLIIIAGGLSINGALNTYGGYGYGFIGGTNIFFWIAGVFEIAAFAIGLTGTVFQTSKQQFLGSIFSNIMIIVASALIITQSFFTITLSYYQTISYLWLLFFAIPALVLASVSIALNAVAKTEFRN